MATRYLRLQPRSCTVRITKWLCLRSPWNETNKQHLLLGTIIHHHYQTYVSYRPYWEPDWEPYWEPDWEPYWEYICLLSLTPSIPYICRLQALLGARLGIHLPAESICLYHAANINILEKYKNVNGLLYRVFCLWQLYLFL